MAESLVEAGISSEIVFLPESAATAVQAAAALGTDVGAIANSLVFWCDGRPLLVMTSGAHRVDTAALAARLGRAAIVRASPEQGRQASGQGIGGVGPSGHPRPLETIVGEQVGRAHG